jgi:hypothetical protein
VRSTQALASADIADAIRMAAVTPARFLAMIDDLRAM